MPHSVAKKKNSKQTKIKLDKQIKKLNIKSYFLEEKKIHLQFKILGFDSFQKLPLFLMFISNFYNFHL